MDGIAIELLKRYVPIAYRKWQKRLIPLAELERFLPIARLQAAGQGRPPIIVLGDTGSGYHKPQAKMRVKRLKIEGD